MKIIFFYNSTLELQNFENLNIPLQNHKNNEIHRIPLQKHENNENLNIPQQNDENHEIHRIPLQN